MQDLRHDFLLPRMVNVQQPRKCPGGGEVYWGKGNVHEQRFKEQSADKSRRVPAIPSIWDRKRICSWGLTTGQTMLSESKLGPLISFSWPLLKLKPQIFPGCHGLHGPLITVVRASLWREGKGWGFGSGGTSQAEMTPSCQLFRCEAKQTGVLYSCRKFWCVTVTGSINPVDLSLAGCVCSSLTEVLVGHRAVPGGT